MGILIVEDAYTMDQIKFQHLPHKDGGLDSICLRCLTTVAILGFSLTLHGKRV
jgi:hypothetical protein